MLTIFEDHNEFSLDVDETDADKAVKDYASGCSFVDYFPFEDAPEHEGTVEISIQNEDGEHQGSYTMTMFRDGSPTVVA